MSEYEVVCAKPEQARPNCFELRFISIFSADIDIDAIFCAGNLFT